MLRLKTLYFTHYSRYDTSGFYHNSVGNDKQSSYDRYILYIPSPIARYHSLESKNLQKQSSSNIVRLSAFTSCTVAVGNQTANDLLTRRSPCTKSLSSAYSHNLEWLISTVECRVMLFLLSTGKTLTQLKNIWMGNLLCQSLQSVQQQSLQPQQCLQRQAFQLRQVHLACDSIFSSHVWVVLFTNDDLWKMSGSNCVH